VNAPAVMVDRRPEIAERHGVTVDTLDDWRYWGWLGTADDAGDEFLWGDPEVDAQVGWLATIARWTGGPDEHDAAAGPQLRTSGCVCAYRVAGTTQWVPLLGDNLEQFTAGLPDLKTVVTTLPVRPPVAREGDCGWEPWG
jgi:hypothetical protein